MDLSIIIVNWNSRVFLQKCLASILTHTRGIELEIIVIDSASFDGSDRMLREHYPQVRFIQSAGNVGFAAANNRAFQQAAGESVLFLNPDTEVVGPAIATLYGALNSLPNCGIVGSKLLNSDGTVQSSCIQSMPTILNQLLDSELLRTKWPTSGLWGMAPLYDPGTDPREVEAISGACLMILRSTFEQVGRFSEDYFMYAEDIDLSYKVRNAGYTNYFVPEATVIHHGGSSSQKAESRFSIVMMREANWRFLRKTRGGAYGLGYKLAMCVTALGRLLLLGLAVPFQTSGRRNASTDPSFRKWLAVLRWGLNRDDLVKQYYPSKRQPSFLS
jgi:GT2 family glycosyltransferase